MQTKYIPATVMLLAGAVVSIISIIQEFDILYTLELLLGVLIVFYLIGMIAKKIVEKALENKKVVDEKKESVEDDKEDVKSERESDQLES